MTLRPLSLEWRKGGADGILLRSAELRTDRGGLPARTYPFGRPDGGLAGTGGGGEGIEDLEFRFRLRIDKDS